jgi:hypothetical protein
VLSARCSAVNGDPGCLGRKKCLVTVLTVALICANHRKISGTPLLVPGFGVIDSTGSAGTHAFIICEPLQIAERNYIRVAHHFPPVGTRVRRVLRI